MAKALLASPHSNYYITMRILTARKEKVDENVKIWYHINPDTKRPRLAFDQAKIIRKALKKRE